MGTKLRSVLDQFPNNKPLDMDAVEAAMEDDLNERSLAAVDRALGDEPTKFSRQHFLLSNGHVVGMDFGDGSVVWRDEPEFLETITRAISDARADDAARFTMHLGDLADQLGQGSLTAGAAAAAATSSVELFMTRTSDRLHRVKEIAQDMPEVNGCFLFASEIARHTPLLAKAAKQLSAAAFTDGFVTAANHFAEMIDQAAAAFQEAMSEDCRRATERHKDGQPAFFLTLNRRGTLTDGGANRAA